MQSSAIKINLDIHCAYINDTRNNDVSSTIESVKIDHINLGDFLEENEAMLKTNCNDEITKPTVLRNVSPKMRVAREVGGPVAPIMVTDDDMQAIKLANDSQYGLGASIWTEDLDKAEKLSRMVVWSSIIQ